MDKVSSLFPFLDLYHKFICTISVVSYQLIYVNNTECKHEAKYYFSIVSERL